jgi:hypothetical protein
MKLKSLFLRERPVINYYSILTSPSLKRGTTTLAI